MKKLWNDKLKHHGIFEKNKYDLANNCIYLVIARSHLDCRLFILPFSSFFSDQSSNHIFFHLHKCRHWRYTLLINKTYVGRNQTNVKQKKAFRMFCLDEKRRTTYNPKKRLHWKELTSRPVSQSFSSVPGTSSLSRSKRFPLLFAIANIKRRRAKSALSNIVSLFWPKQTFTCTRKVRKH